MSKFNVEKKPNRVTFDSKKKFSRATSLLIPLQSINEKPSQETEEDQKKISNYTFGKND